MKVLGKGHIGAKNLWSLMNMPPPLAAKNYSKVSSVITSCLRSIAKGSMSKAAEEIKNLNERNDSARTVNCTVFCGGTWQENKIFVKK